MKLVYLVFADNTAYCRVVEQTPKGVTIDLEKKTWEYALAEICPHMPIGRARYLPRWSRHGVIGVYDLDDCVQVNTMVHDAIESQRDYRDAD